MLTTGEVPSALKTAFIIPLFKKPTGTLLTCQTICLCRIYHLSPSYWKKVFAHLTYWFNPYTFQHQSAYRRFHSTETAMLRLLSNLTAAVKTGNPVLMEFLNMSIAFDTVDHQILLQKQDTSFGIRYDATKLISFYLLGRTHSVVMSVFSSWIWSIIELCFGPASVICIYCIRVRWKTWSIGMSSHLTAMQLFFLLTRWAEQSHGSYCELH